MSPDNLPTSLPTRLLVTIDTECDKTRSWHTASPVAFRGIHIGVAQLLEPLFKQYGVRPTYLISREVMMDAQSVEVLGSLADVELSTHLHGEYVPPIEMRGGDRGLAGSITNEMQWEYGPQLEAAKLAQLTATFEQKFGRRARSFRAGRFGIGPHTGAILQRLGYCIDSSVTPHKSWISRLGQLNPDFSQCAEHPYAMREDGHLFHAGDSDFLELPVTLLTNAAQPERPIWFRPWASDAATLAQVVRQVHEQAPLDGVSRPLVMMFHNMEVIPGASPYPQTLHDVDRYLASLHRTFELTRQLGIKPVTMSEYYDEWKGVRDARRASSSTEVASA